MSAAPRRALGALLALAAVLGVAALTRVPYAPASEGDALLRLSWRLRGEPVEECRTLSAEELASVPAHMRQERICERHVLPYHLHVVLDGRTVLDDTVRARGARGDRPLYVFRELPLSAGQHELRVSFVRIGGPEPAEESDSDDREHHERHERHDAEREYGRERDRPATTRLELGAAVAPAAGEVVLVTYDADRGALVARAPGQPHGP